MASEALQPIIEAQITSSDVLAYLQDPKSSPLTFIAEDPEQIAARIEAQEIAAKSPEELFGGDAVLHARDLIGQSFQLRSCSYRPSDQPGGLPVFGVFSISTLNGESAVLVCGARSVVRKAAVADAKGWLPLWVKITEGKPTANGTPLDLSAGTAPAYTADGSAF